MSALLQALWTSIWREAVVSVYATGADSALSLESARSLLSEDERERAGRFRFRVDQDRWTKSRAILRSCLAERLDLEPGELEFAAGEFGKPCLKGRAAGQTGLHFNTSHSGDYVAVCLSPEPCGVDIECWKTDYAEEVAAFAFRETECAGLALAPSPVQHFLALWTAKEAVMKCTGQGLAIPPSAVWIDDPASSANGFAGIDGTGLRFALLRHWVPGEWMLTAALPSAEANLDPSGQARDRAA